MQKTIADYPNLVLEWHPNKNGNLQPKDVTHKNQRKVWWQCCKGHEWEAVVGNRANGNRCPYCTNMKVHTDNCLATMYPAIAQEWHPIKNGTLTPNDVFPNISKAIWWICSKGHEWKETGAKRVQRLQCPYCSNQKVCQDNCLAATHPELAKEWHPTKNGILTPNDVFAGTNKKQWWICSKGHEWKINVAYRKKYNCPYCSNVKVCRDNCLATTHPEIIEKWHPTKNKITPSDITSGSDKKIWWICSKGHEWLAELQKITHKQSGCPYCSNHKVCKDNCFATTHPKLAKDWHPTKNGKLTPNDIFAGSGKKHWWICSKGHEYKTCVDHKVKHNCPYCSNKKVCQDNCLATTHPELAKEWHPTKNGILTPNDVFAGTYKKHWWLCSRGHTWLAAASSRSSTNKSGCNRCKESKGENAISEYLVKNNIKFRKEYSFTKSKISKHRFDFAIKSGLIEYHGAQHYVPVNFGSKKQYAKTSNFIANIKNDHKKEKWCKQHKIPLLVIPYWDFDRIEDILDSYFAGNEPIISPEPVEVKKYEPMRQKIMDRFALC